MNGSKDDNSGADFSASLHGLPARLVERLAVTLSQTLDETQEPIRLQPVWTFTCEPSLRLVGRLELSAVGAFHRSVSRIRQFGCILSPVLVNARHRRLLRFLGSSRSIRKDFIIVRVFCSASRFYDRSVYRLK